MNYIQYMKPGGNFGDKLKTGIKKFLKAAGEASRMAKDARINNPGAAMIRDAYAKGDEELAKLLTDEMQAANLTGIALGSGAAPLITGFTVAPVTTGVTLATGMAGGTAGMYGTDKAINYFSDGKYTGWGNWINQATNDVIGENTAGVFHPGAIFGGAIAGAVGNKIVSTTNRGKLESLNSELNKLIESSKLNKPFTKLDVLDGYLFHNGHVEVSPAGHNGEKYTYILREAKPGALKIEEGKYKSVRQPYGDNPDLIWWDAEGHNYGKKVYVTKLGDDATHVMSNMEDLPISQVIERYEPSYYVTKLKPVNSVIEYTFDPISGAPIPHMPGKVLNNKMSYEEILTHPVLLQSKTTPTKTSLAFFERLPAKISEAERLGIPKGQERFIADHENLILANAKSFAEKYGYEIPETIDAAKAMYKQHNSWFRTVMVDPLYDNSEYGLAFTDTKLQTLPKTESAKILASRGYPAAYRFQGDYEPGIYLDDFVFASPSMATNAGYLGGPGTYTVMLQRPFSFRNPLDWHNAADYRPISKYIYEPLLVGLTLIGNVGPKYELKLATKHLIPVKIAQPADKGTLLGEYLGNIEYKSGGSIKIKKKNIGSFTRYCKGKVTEECIRKGKNSSNPTTRKRANFAANARKWKHEEGGKLNYLNYFK